LDENEMKMGNEILATLTGRVEGVPEGDEGLETDHGNYTTSFMVLVNSLQECLRLTCFPKST
jgi:hypothetical protein